MGFVRGAIRRFNRFYARWERENRVQMYLVYIGREYRPTHNQVNYELHRALLHKLPATLTFEEWEWMVKESGNKCLSCGTSGIHLAIDHVKPLSLGGGTTLGNVEPLCVLCNSRKGAKYIDYRSRELIQRVNARLQRGN